MPETLSTRRLRWLLRLLLVWAAAVFCKLIWLQVVHHDELVKLAEQQQQKTVEIEAPRGTIFDRTGQPLAKTLPAESICINPMKIPDAGVAADLLSRVLDLNREPLYNRISLAKVRNSGFLWVKRKVSAEEAERVRSLHLDWVEFRPEMRRFYPHGELASHVLGSTGIVDPDDVIEHGNGGVEMSFDDELSGRPGLAKVYNDVRQNAYDSVVSRAPEPGTNLTLTLDPNLQYEAEKSLAAAVWVETHGDKGHFAVLSVDPAFQGRGLGRIMIDAVEDHCRKAGCSSLDLEVVNLRDELPAFYSKFGFEPAGTAPFPSTEKLTQPACLLLMTKPLGKAQGVTRERNLAATPSGK